MSIMILLIFWFHLISWTKGISAEEGTLNFNVPRRSCPFWYSHCGSIIKQHWKCSLFVQYPTKGYPVLSTTSFLIQGLQIPADIPQMAALLYSGGWWMHGQREEKREGKRHEAHPCIAEQRRLPDSTFSGGGRWKRSRKDISKGITGSHNQNRTMQGRAERGITPVSCIIL